ncbi:MAG: aminotransferase class I/II-fold pyridoxal phosphate-dependent enzyme [Firmicutes bacterium]|nr:aminotransferase class I/II-fold pyridoxal phosphate-dependent enzyme [Bacillota bacterium]
MKYDFETIADSIDYGFGTDFREDFTMMAGAQLHVKTAPCITEALARLSQAGLYGWTSSADPQYINAIVNWMKVIRDWDVEKEWIVPSYGILQAMCACMRAFSEEGDGVILQPPYYVLYEREIRRCKRTMVENTLICKDGYYEMDFADLEEKMKDPKNKLMILCNPHNPLMDVWPKENLEKVAALAKKYNVIVMADEIFAEHAFGAEMTPYAKVKDTQDNCVICTSLGKAFNFTGTSHSNIIIPNEELRAKYIEQRDSDHYGSLSPFMRAALLAAYTPEGKDWIDALMVFNQENDQLIRGFFAEHFPEVKVFRHTAGTLVWTDWRAFGDEEKVKTMFDTAGVCPDEGYKYGEAGRGFMRLQIGMPKKELQGALDRLAKARKELNY